MIAADRSPLCTGPFGDRRRYTVDRAQLDGGRSGGEGLVVRAWDRRAGNHVALKMLTARPVRDVDMLAERLRDFGLLVHPNLMRHYAVFAGPSLAAEDEVEDSNDVIYVVQEWIEGVRLSEISLGDDLGAALRRLAAVARAVAALRDVRSAGAPSGLVHRDIKPSNVLVCADGRTVLVDYGTARPLALDELTTGVGTYRWCAPEVVTGAYPVGAAVDVWAVGALGHWMLTGQPPLLDGAPAACERMAHSPHARALKRRDRLARHIAALLATDPSRRPTDLERWADTLLELGNDSWVPSARRVLTAGVVAAVGMTSIAAALRSMAYDGVVERESVRAGATSVSSSSLATTTSTLSPIVRLSADYRFADHSGAVATLANGPSGTPGESLTLIVSGVIQSTWTYGGTTEEEARDNCRTHGGMHILDDAAKAQIEVAPMSLVVALESSDGAAVAPMGNVVLDNGPVEAQADWFACSSAALQMTDDPIYRYGVTVPIELWRPDRQYRVVVPDSLPPGRWIVVITDRGERALCDTPLQIDVVAV